MRPSLRALLALAALLAGLSQPPDAHAFVQARTDSGKPILWTDTSCVGLTPDAAFDTGQLDPASALAAIQRAVDHWRSAATCAYLALQILPAQSGVPVGYNQSGKNVNLIKFVSSGWTHDPGAAAITTVTFSDLTGKAFDADIELNAQAFVFATLPESGGLPTETDLENTLVHEFGHLMGLDHTCDDGQRTPTPVDHLGNTIPRCCPLEDPGCRNRPAAQHLAGFPEVVESTMFNFADGGETKKRTPEPDDVLGLCTLYPMASKPAECVPEYDITGGSDGCSVAPAAPAPASPWRGVPLVLVAVLATLVCRSRLGRPARRS